MRFFCGVIRYAGRTADFLAVLVLFVFEGSVRGAAFFHETSALVQILADSGTVYSCFVLVGICYALSCIEGDV
jgi:hypothetical protein